MRRSKRRIILLRNRVGDVWPRGPKTKASRTLLLSTSERVNQNGFIRPTRVTEIRENYDLYAGRRPFGLYAGARSFCASHYK